MYSGFSSYLSAAFEPADAMVEKAQKVLGDLNYDTMVGTGLSGALVIPTIARLMGKKFALVRKSGDSSHRERVIEGYIGARWVFVDDFVSSGDTLKRVMAEIEVAQNGQPYGWPAFTTEFVGTYQYARANFVSAERKYFY